jgi:DNA-binding GntR family transcriptional regulator
MNESGIQPIPKKQLYRDEIRETIRDAILNNDLKPGERIVETAWARELGVSQAPVREAIRELEVMGLVENIPYQGTFVRKITKKDLMDSYYVRMALEELGVRNACRYITEERLELVRSTLDQMEAAAQDGNFTEYVRQNARFHQEIINATDNKMLLRLWNQCNILEWTYVGTRFSTHPLDVLAKRHEVLYEAIATRNEEQAVRETRHHIQTLVDELEKSGREEP